MQPRPHHSGSILGPFWGPLDPQSIFSLSHRDADADADVTLDPGQVFLLCYASSVYPPPQIELLGAQASDTTIRRKKALGQRVC